ALATLELDPAKYSSYEKYCSSVVTQMDGWLKPIDDPQALREIFWKCHALGKGLTETPQDKIQWIEPHSESLYLIMYRLSEIKTPEAAAVLVELYWDPKAGWDGGAGEAASDAVVRCGKAALPFLG